MRLAILLFTLAGLAACAPRGDLLVQPEAAGIGEEVDVFIATTRRLLVGTDPSLYRTPNTRYLKRRVSVPPDRGSGTVTAPAPPIDPTTQFVATEAVTYAGGDAFRRDLARALRSRPRGEREVVVYVHGFNNTFSDGVLRIAQLSHDLELPGVAVHFSWPSSANPVGYGYDRDSVLFSRDGLEELLRTVSRSGAERVLVVAHSMGGLLVMETLRQIAIASPSWPSRELDGVVLISPDIDIEVFQAQARRIGDLPDPFAIFVSERDRVLRLSARVNRQPNRLGNIADAEALAELDVTLLDISEFSTGAGHFTAASSPALLALMRRLGDVERAFDADQAGRAGLIPGTVLTVQNATEILIPAPR
ncbi:MAG: alpha/beta fold hydrolase [Paracoccaceae bacterium]|nr:alpha/beta fold hydrolase [Paracoccaceae bacterium]